MVMELVIEVVMGRYGSGHGGGHREVWRWS